MSVIIGIDPHKALHAASAIDRTEAELCELKVRTGPRQLTQLLEWASPFPTRTWAIESAGGLGYLLAQQLVARGEHVVDVPSTLASRVRVLGSGRSNKNDANDARAVAVAALRSPSLQSVRGEDHVSVLRLLAKAHLDTSRARSRSCSRLHATVNELVAGGIRKEVVVNQAECILAGIVPMTVVQQQRVELAHELVEDIRALDVKMKRSKTPHHHGRHRVGDDADRDLRSRPDHRRDAPRLPGDVTRFATAGHFAAYNGTAPIEFSSSGRTVHRLSRRGNRTLNHAIHMIAVTQIRNAGSEGRAYYDARIAVGRTRREARRSLKRHISDRVFRHLRADVRAN